MNVIIRGRIQVMKNGNKTLFILCGEAFAGKTTLSKKMADLYEAKIVGRDEVYFAIEKILALENTPDKDDDTLWGNLWPLVIQGAKNQLSLGNSVVIDDNCLFLKQRDELRLVAEQSGAKNILIYLNIPNNILKERKTENKNSKNRHDVPSEWMAEDSSLFERPTEIEKPVIYTPDISFEDLVKIISVNF